VTGVPNLPTSAPELPGYRHVYSGKVRDLYAPEGDDSRLLVVATDRISAYDHVLATPIPEKGRVLTQLSLWWFAQLRDIVPNHLAAGSVPDEVAGRAVLVQRLDMYPVECVARGYLTGSGLKDYQRTGAVSGVTLPPGLEDGSRLPEPIFTPSSKAPQGQHDEAITYADVVDLVGAETAARIRDLTLEVYRMGAEVTEKNGILLADTKLEFGRDATGQIVLGDEVLTPDSSRFWPADQWEPGRPQYSFDKQYAREWALSTGWDKTEPGPEVPPEVVAAVRARYAEVYERITGTPWP